MSKETDLAELSSAGQPRAPPPHHAKTGRAGDPGVCPHVSIARSMSLFLRQQNNLSGRLGVFDEVVGALCITEGQALGDLWVNFLLR